MSGAAPKLVSVQTTQERGGGEYANVDLLDALAQRGWIVRFMTNMPELAAGTRVPTRRVRLGPKLSRRHALHVLGAFPLASVRLALALAAEAPVDVLLVHYKKEQLIAALLPRRLRGAIVWAEWGPVPGQLRHGLGRCLYLAAARRADTVVAVSDGTRRSLVEVGVPAGKVRVVPNVVDVATIRFDAAARRRLRAEWGAADGTFVIGYVGRFQARKRPDVVIDALDHLDGDVLLVFAGDGAQEAELRRRAARHGPRVRFIPTPRGYVQEVLSACDVQVYAPSPTEGAPRSIIFGQLTERPVIATAHEGAVDMIAPGTGAIVSEPHDPRALAACLAEYRSDAARRAREGAAARRYAAARYDRSTVASQFEEILWQTLR